MADGTDRFLEPRRVDCPACGSTDLVVRVTSPDLMQHKPGRFRFDRCRSCETVFQNPRPTGEGLDFYYRDFYDGLGADLLELLFGFGPATHTERAALVDGLAQPSRWLDVGTGHGHFPMMAKEVWPDARFAGLDQSDGVDEALRRGWMDEAHHGQLTEVAVGLRDRFDVVSMFHYLEHTADPAAELDAATVALQAGGHLVIEMPDPQHPVARWLGRYWVPWMAPQHLNMVSVDRLGEMLEERGYTIVRRQTGEAHTGGDVTGGVLLALQHVAPPTFPVPWRDPATLGGQGPPGGRARGVGPGLRRRRHRRRRRRPAHPAGPAQQRVPPGRPARRGAGRLAPRRALIAEVGVDGPEERLAGGVAADVLGDAAGQQRLGHLRRVGGVRRDEAPRLGPQRVPLGEWLGIGDVERRPADLLTLQRRDQGIGVDMGAASDVDQPGVALHEVELVRADQVVRLRRGRQGQDDRIGAGQHLVEPVDGRRSAPLPPDGGRDGAPP